MGLRSVTRDVKLVDLPLVEIGKKFPCDGCIYIKMGRSRDGLPESKSRTCIAPSDKLTGCVITDTKRRVWVSNDVE